MKTRDQIRADVIALTKEGIELAEKFQKDKKAKGFHFGYQAWYTKALTAVKSLAPDRIAEFRAFYEPDPKRKGMSYATYTIQDFLKGVVPVLPIYEKPFDARTQALSCLFNQITIMSAMRERVDSTLSNIEGTLYAELQENEVETARQLARVSLRAAGALVGVVIEGHLQKVASAHGVTIAKKHPTIADLNDPLKAASVIDLPTWRKISYFADIRNLCSHKKDREPTENDVKELIEGAEWVSKNVF